MIYVNTKIMLKAINNSCILIIVLDLFLIFWWKISVIRDNLKLLKLIPFF
jgi:hypothetical protein